MKSNLDYFNMMPLYPEQALDEYYYNLNNVVIIPEIRDADNELTQATEALYRYIDTFETLNSDLTRCASDEVNHALLLKIDEILMTQTCINYTSFCQFFMVHNLSHSLYISLDANQRIEILKNLIKDYIIQRHHIYKSHGYTNVVLQTMCDNYSHKRKGSAGINKIIQQLREIGISRKISDISQDAELNCYYITPDKGDKTIFESLLQKYGVLFKFRAAKQGKLPDVLIKVDSEFFIVEHKSMKEGGGGQDKQIVEILDFIRDTEPNSHFHYVTYLDGLFANKFMDGIVGKNKNITQYNECKRVLSNNPGNYFVNTVVFMELLKDVFRAQ